MMAVWYQGASTPAPLMEVGETPKGFVLGDMGIGAREVMVEPVSAQTPAKHALARLGIERLVLSLHQLSFPAGDDDIGVGTPYTARARDVLAWTRDLGFTG